MSKRRRSKSRPPVLKAKKSKINDIEYQTLTPFGNLVFAVSIDPEMVKKLNSICDTAIEKDKLDWGHKLVGNIKNEWLVQDALLKNEGIYEYFCNIANMYLGSCTSMGRKYVPSAFKSSNVMIQSAWVNEMKKYEYNPVHFHTNCVLSSVLYLKVPDFASNPILKEKYDNKRNVDGCIEFINHSYFPGYGDAGNFVVEPEVGKFYIFPAGLQHTVYPFGCDGIRRSMAINFY